MVVNYVSGFCDGNRILSEALLAALESYDHGLNAIAATTADECVAAVGSYVPDMCVLEVRGSPREPLPSPPTRGLDDRRTRRSLAAASAAAARRVDRRPLSRPRKRTDDGQQAAHLLRPHNDKGRQGVFPSQCGEILLRIVVRPVRFPDLDNPAFAQGLEPLLPAEQSRRLA